MSIIYDYYEGVKLHPSLIKICVDLFDKHPDIKKEFEYWIEERNYISKKCVEVEGYTAESIAKEFPVLDGEGAFNLLVQLRENPEKAKKQISRGFRVK